MINFTQSPSANGAAGVKLRGKLSGIPAILAQADRVPMPAPGSIWGGALKDTPFAPALASLSTTNSILAAQLQWHFDVVLPQAQRKYDAAFAPASSLEGCTPSPAPPSDPLTVIAAKLTAAKAALAAAQAGAIVPVAAAGGNFDPTNIMEFPPLPDINAIASGEDLAWGVEEDEKGVLPKAAACAVTAGIGAVIGVSLGIMAKYLSYDSLAEQPAVLGGCAVFGIAAAVCVAEAVRESWRWATAARLSGQKWKTLAAIALLTSATVTVIDSIVEMQGLLAGVRQAFVFTSHTALTPLTQASFYLAATLMTLPYVVMNSYVGYRQGRRAIAFKLRGIQAVKHAESIEKRRQDADTVRLDTAAAVAIGKVRVAAKEVEDITAEKTELERHQKQSAPKPVRTPATDASPTLTPAQASALIGLIEAEQTWKRLLTEAKTAIEPRGLRGSLRAVRDLILALRGRKTRMQVQNIPG